MKARALLVLISLVASGCDKLPLPGRKGESGAQPAAQAEAKSLLDQGQPDAVLEKLRGDETPDGLYQQGLAWLKKAQAAPAPPDAGLKPEERTALDFLEKAVAARPGHGPAHLAIAEMLAPHALRLYGPQARKQASRPRPKPSPAEPEVEATPDRVVREFRAAIRADPIATEAVESLIRFAREAKRLDDTEEGYRELLARQKENPAPYVAYGDFLASDRKDRIKAIEQYNLALVWKADDEEIKSRIADLYIAMGEEHFAKQEFAAAQARFTEARKWVSDRQSFQAKTIQSYLGKLAALRR